MTLTTGSNDYATEDFTERTIREFIYETLVTIANYSVLPVNLSCCHVSCKVVSEEEHHPIN